MPYFGDSSQTTVESELQGRTPRRVRYTGGTQTARFFVWLLFLGGMGLITGGGLHDLGQLKALRAHGETTTGHITGSHVSHGKSDSYYLDYMFMTDRGMVSDDENVTHQEYSRSSDGDPLTITYLPDDPDIHRVGTVDDRYIHNSTTGWIAGGAVTFLALGLILLLTERNFRSHLALLANGVPVTGRITDRKMVQGSKANYYYIYYEFDGPGGTISKKVSVSKALFDKTNPGTAATILYNPVKPSDNRPYQAMTDVRLG